MREINIALLGFGTVGSGVAEVIRRNGKIIEDQIDCKLRITHVLVRNTEKYRDLDILKDVVVTDDFNCVIDAAPEIIIEVMGGIHPAKEYIFEALNYRINVVSANKDLVALSARKLCIRQPRTR